MAAVERETPVFELSLSITREVGNEPALAVTDGFDIDTLRGGLQSEFGGVAHMKLAVGGLAERLARHAAAQDAQAPKFLCAINHGNAQTRAVRRSGRCIAPTAAADDHEIKVVFCHGERCRAGERCASVES